MTRIFGVLCAAALLVAGMHEAAVRGLADAHYTRARLTLTEGVPAGSAPRPESLSLALASLREAQTLEPSNPHFVEQAAHARELQALRLQRDDPAQHEGLRQSLALYRKAAAMRPGSPYVWSSIALLKLRLGELDAEFHGALERAAQFGPWEPTVQIAVADIGLVAWRRLGPSSQALVVANLERALLRQASEVRRVATARGVLPFVCFSSTQPLQPRTRKFCDEVLVSR